MSGNAHIGDIGTAFILTLRDQDGAVLDISTQTSLTMRFQKPDGTALTVTPALATDGTDGKIRYATVSGDLDQAGTWQVQGAVTMPTWEGSTDVVTFTVEPVLPEEAP